MKFEIKREEVPYEGAYKAISADGRVAGYMTYKKPEPSRVIVDHTRVEEDFGGQGVGAMLAERAISDARAEGRKIVPVCSFLAHYCEKNADATADVLAKQ